MTETPARRFQTSGDLTSELVGKIYITFCGKYRQSKTHKILMIGIGIEILLMVALGILKGEGVKGFMPLIVFAGVYVLLDIFMNWSVHKGAKMMVKRFEEESHTGIRGNTSSFTDGQVHLENHDSGGSCDINLTEMKRVMQVENIWVLVAKTGAFVPVFVEQLDEADRESLLALLKQNNPKIKIQLPKKK